MPHPQFKRTKPKTKPKHPQDAKVYQTGPFLLCQNTNRLYFLFPLCLSRPWQSLLLGFLKSSTLVYFLFSPHVIRYIFQGFPVLLLDFFPPCYCWDNVSFPPTAVNCVCWRGPEQFLLCVSFHYISGNNHGADLQAPRVAQKPWNLTIRK